MDNALKGEIKGFKAIKEHFSAGNLADAYLFFGEEEYLKSLYLERVRKLCGADMNEYRYIGKPDLNEIDQITGGISLFGDKNLVIIEDSGYFKNGSDITFLKDACGDSTTFVFLESTVDRRTKNFKEFLGLGIAFECTRVEAPDAVRMLSQKATSSGRKLTPSAAELLINGIGLDLYTLLNELDKLILYTNEGDAITDLHVKKVCNLSLSAKVFDLTDAIVKGNRAQALKIMNALLDDRENPIMLLSIIGGNWLKLYNVKCMLSDKYQISDIQKKMPMNPYALKKLCEQASRMDIRTIEDRIEFCRKMDAAVKSGEIKDTDALELVVM